MVSVPGTYKLAAIVAATMSVVALAFAIVSLSTRPSIGSIVLADLHPGTRVERLLGVFRASGRFVWPLTYLVMAWALANVGRLRWGAAVLALLLLVQQADLFPKYKEFRIRFREGPPHIEQPVADPRWARALSRCPRLELVTGPQPAGKWVGAALAAAKAGARFYPAPTARYSPEAAVARQDAVKQLLTANVWRSDVVYLLVHPLPEGATVASVAAALPAHMRHLSMDGYELAVPSACLGP